MAVVAAGIAVFAQAPAPAAQGTPAPAALTAADYARAERLMSYNVNPLVLHA